MTKDELGIIAVLFALVGWFTPISKQAGTWIEIIINGIPKWPHNFPKRLVAGQFSFGAFLKSGTPKSSIFMGFSSLNMSKPSSYWGTPMTMEGAEQSRPTAPAFPWTWPHEGRSGISDISCKDPYCIMGYVSICTYHYKWYNTVYMKTQTYYSNFLNV